jgi:Fe-S cluster assembly ATP-binding protein
VLSAGRAGASEARALTMLTIEDLSVAVGDREILKRVNLRIGAGEVHALLGPNGSGKTTLLLAIMGYPQFRVTSGTISFRGEDITGATVDERARLGLGMSFQKPPAVKGVTLGNMVEMVGRWRGRELDVPKAADALGVAPLMDRGVNVGYSGGETKRSELLQLMAQSPALVMLDEPESGVDLVNIGIVGEAINELLGKQETHRGARSISGLLITHTGIILDYVNADFGHVLCDGELICSGNPRDLLVHIREYGYEHCRVCPV